MAGNQALREKLAGRRVVASVSGGKDSAAMSLWLTEQGIDHDRVYMDTGWEAQETYEYISGPLTTALGPIRRISPTTDMKSLVRERKGFPGGRTRFCTTELKFNPIRAHLAELMDRGADVVNAIGIRRAESVERADATEWEWSDDLDCEVWRPIVSWSVDEVISIHQRHGLRPNPLYLRGFTRVGCYPCIHASKSEIALLARTDPDRIAEIALLEQEIGAVSNADPKPSFFTLRDRDGKKHRTPISEVVAWAYTSRGGRQLTVFQEIDQADAGCMRWGMCETAEDEVPHGG